MKINLIIVLVGIICFGCGHSNNLVSLMKDPNNGFTQLKKAGDKSVLLEFLPPVTSQTESGRADSCYKIRITLKGNKKITGNAEMQYMNFTIKNSIYALYGRDTLVCIGSERIPGIEEMDFQYIAVFEKGNSRATPDKNLQIGINASQAGWEKTDFIIKGVALKKLESIKY